MLGGGGGGGVGGLVHLRVGWTLTSLLFNWQLCMCFYCFFLLLFFSLQDTLSIFACTF